MSEEHHVQTTRQQGFNFRVSYAPVHQTRRRAKVESKKDLISFSKPHQGSLRENLPASSLALTRSDKSLRQLKPKVFSLYSQLFLWPAFIMKLSSDFP